MRKWAQFAFLISNNSVDIIVSISYNSIMEELKEQIIEAKVIYVEIKELENYYSKRRSQKALAQILELRDRYNILLSTIHQQTV